MRRASLLALALGGCLAGCRAQPAGEIAHLVEVAGAPIAAPGPSQVRQAAARLGDALLRRFPPWPPDLARSQDFPQLPLVEIAPVQDRSGRLADRDLLARTLADALRARRNLRLLADERAVPPALRDDPTPRDAVASLVVRGRAGRDGRFHLTFGRRAGRPWVEVASDPARPPQAPARRR